MLDRTLLDTLVGSGNVWILIFLFFCCCYFFLAALSLRWCMRAFSSCSKWGLHSSCSTWTLGHVGSIVVDHWLSCPEACGIFSNQEWNLYVLHWQADSYPLDHHESPESWFFSLLKNSIGFKNLFCRLSSIFFFFVCLFWPLHWPAGP